MTHINLRRDTAANWTAANPVLHLGETGWERDTGKGKQGDGLTAWNSLDYVNITQEEFDAFALAVASDILTLDTDKAPLASPALTGNPTTPTPTAGDSDTSIANTAFVTDAVAKQKEVIGIALGDEDTVITTGLKVTFRMPFAMTLTEFRTSLTGAGSGPTVIDLKESGTTVLSTKPSIDASEKTSLTGTQAVISDPTIADDAEMTLIIDTAGGGATGPKCWLIGTRT